MVTSVDYSLLPSNLKVLIKAKQGACTNGCAHPPEQNLFVATICNRFCHESGERPTLLSVAEEAGVSVGFVSKIVGKLDGFGTVSEPDPKAKCAGPCGVRSKSSTLECQHVLLELLH